MLGECLSLLKATAIERAIEANNMPDGVFSLLHGTTPEIGADIVTRSQIKDRTRTAQHCWVECRSKWSVSRMTVAA